MSKRAVAVLLFAAFACGPRQAEAVEPADLLDLRYEATLLGLPLASASAVVDASATFRIAGDLETRGLVDVFSPWRHRAVSTGRLSADGTRIEAVRHRGDGQRRGDRRHMQILFEPGRTTIEAAEPDPDTRSEERHVSPADRIGAVDPLTAFYLLARRLDTGAGCDATVPIFDGRTRYDIVLRAGPDALTCRFGYRQIAGFSERKSPLVDTSEEAPGTIRYTRTAPGFPPIPARLEVPTRYGSVVVALSGWQLERRTAAASP